jgi:hypothetical protein
MRLAPDERRLSPSTTRQIDGSKMPDRRGVGFEARMSDRKGIAVGVVPSACACFFVSDESSASPMSR